MRNPVTRFATFGTMFRFWGIFACDYYLPAYFLGTFPAYNNMFGLSMMFIAVLCGMTSVTSGGVLADKLVKKYPDVYPNLCMYGSLFAWPFFTLSVLMTNNFWFSIGLTALKYLIGENFWSPNITLV